MSFFFFFFYKELSDDGSNISNAESDNTNFDFVPSISSSVNVSIEKEYNGVGNFTSGTVTLTSISLDASSTPSLLTILAVRLALP